MDHTALGGAGQQANPFGSYEAYGCVDPRHTEAARIRRRSRALLLVAYALMAAGIVISPAHAAVLGALY